VQDVFTVLVQKLPEFRYDPNKRFRGWLWTIMLNKWREHRRHLAPAPIEVNATNLDEAASPDSVREFWEQEYAQQVMKRALKVMQAEFQPTTWKACWESVVAERPATDIAKELGITVNAVHIAKWRVLRRLREELKDLLD
jgi:RNA polymerase sigma-70 factor (ECF subfamily)